MAKRRKKHEWAKTRAGRKLQAMHEQSVRKRKERDAPGRGFSKGTRPR